MPLPVSDQLHRWMVALRRDLHAHPELSWQEERTARKVEKALGEMDIACGRVAGTGVVAEIPGSAETPVVALRADLDALPIQEETGLEFASTRPGVMHACAHDGHTAMLLGAARLLAEEPRLPAPVRLIFQPAEEKGAGAQALIEAGVLENVGMIFGGHLDRHFATGMLLVTEGVVGASTDAFKIAISGRGAHAARPHEAIDAVVAGSLMVMAIQTIVSREVDPAHPSVVSVGSFHAGTIGNAIAARAELEGTIRSQDSETREALTRAVRRIARSVAEVHGAGLELDFVEGTPALVNGAAGVAVARRAARVVAGDEGVGELAHANMGGEDFAHYLERLPGCYVRYGAQVPGREGFPAHSSRFDFDEAALAYGAAWLHRVALEAGTDLAAGVPSSIHSRVGA